MPGLVISQARTWQSCPLFSPPSPNSSLVCLTQRGESESTAEMSHTPFPTPGTQPTSRRPQEEQQEEVEELF